MKFDQNGNRKRVIDNYKDRFKKLHEMLKEDREEIGREKKKKRILTESLFYLIRLNATSIFFSLKIITAGMIILYKDYLSQPKR